MDRSFMMKKKNLLAMTMAAAMSVTCLTGCELVVTNNRKDMEQVVAQVNLAKSEDFSDGGVYAAYASAIDEQSITKREMISYFVNTGYIYIQSYGYTYSKTFDLIVNSLVNQRIVSQYAKAYFFELSKDSAEYNFTMADYQKYVADAKDPEVAAYRYFLTDDEYNQAVYALNQNVNGSIDSFERKIINEEEESSSVTPRTLPKGVKQEKEEYYDKDYAIYTGKNAVSACGSYETVKGSTPTTRKKAYNKFLLSLQANYLYDKSEQGLAIEDLSYYKVELARQLSSMLISKLGDTLEKETEKTLTKDYVTARYAELLSGQKNSFNASESAFETAIDALSDSSFVLYSPNANYGFVLNILLKFSDTQSYLLSGYQSDTNLSENERYQKRASLLKNLTAKDQRETWFTGDEDYSYVSSDAFGGEYVFFEDGLTENDQYETIKNYYGKYAYQGSVEKKDDKYTFQANKIDIDGFIDQFEGYVSYATGRTPSVSIAKPADYYTRNYLNEQGSVDYSKFVYYAGKFDVDFNRNTLFVPGTVANNAFSAVNELSFAYNMDTAGLNSYLGYSVNAYDTQFVKEFEYAAKLAVEMGVGSYTIAPSDYGWHIMYCTYTFDDSELYTFNYDDIETEGTFSYYFYEALKSSTSGTSASAVQTKVINSYNNDTCVERFESRYEDLKKLDN